MSATAAIVQVPDTALAREATDLVRERADDVLFHHSRRVFMWGTLKAGTQGLDVDPELAYIGGMFHDLGLTPPYRSSEQRFEIDGADAARAFLLDHGRSAQEAKDVWLAIALHTTPAIPHRLGPTVAVVTLGVETDVLGIGLDDIEPQQRAAVLAAHPRPDFKNTILQHFYDGMAHRPDTTFGTMNDDVLAAFDPGFARTNFVEIIRDSGWPE